MMNFIIYSFRFIFRHKFKVMVTFGFIFVFLLVLFPINDLNDLITAQISKLTNRKVFIQFDAMSLNPLGPKLTLEKIFVESGNLPTLTVDSLSLKPSLAALVSQQPEGTLSAEGFLKGDLQISISSATKSEAGNARSRIEAHAKNLNLKDIRELANLPVPLLGKINLSSTAIADLTFQEQPEMDLNLTISKFEMPSTSVSLADLGRVNLPLIKMGHIELKGKLAGGKFLIESGKLGTPADELYGDVKGNLGLTFMNAGGQVFPVMGGYNIDLNLKATAGFKERAKFFLGFLDGYKTE